MTSSGARRGGSRFGAIVRSGLTRLADPGGFGRYAYANAALNAEADSRPRVVFIGDSIIEGWAALQAIAPPDLCFINRGCAGQTSSQIRRRFERDVLDLTPSRVVILAGGNDLRAAWGRPAARGRVVAPLILCNVEAMVDAAAARGIGVAIAALTPLAWFSGARASVSRRDTVAIVEINARLQSLAAARGAAFLDFHTALRDETGAMRRTFTDDGLHPNAAGYAALGGVVGQFIL